jgi:hypothetical protein
MYLTHLKSKRSASLRMFPRLASRPNAKRTVARRHVMLHKEPIAVGATRESDRAQLRVRLLKMIVDNERVRRNEPHAS